MRLRVTYGPVISVHESDRREILSVMRGAIMASDYHDRTQISKVLTVPLLGLLLSAA
jgi:hypothetical protein